MTANRIINGGFETGSIYPFSASNVFITNTNSHLGVFSAQLVGGVMNSYLAQFVSISPHETFKFFASFTKIGSSISPPIRIVIAYYDASFNFLENGLVTQIVTDRLCTNDEGDWLEVYFTTSPAPDLSSQAFVLINKLPQSDSANMLVDDVSLVSVTSPIGTTDSFA